MPRPSSSNQHYANVIDFRYGRPLDSILAAITLASVDLFAL